MKRGISCWIGMIGIFLLGIGFFLLINEKEANIQIETLPSKKVGILQIGGISFPIVSQGNGIYKVRNEYVFRGEDLIDKKTYFPNFVQLGNFLWRIVKVNEDASIKLIFYGKKWKEQNSFLSLKIPYTVKNSNSSLEKNYEESEIRNYLNETILKKEVTYQDRQVRLLPLDYEQYLQKEKVDITPYQEKEQFKDLVLSSYEDYVMLLSVREYFESSPYLIWDKKLKSYRCQRGKANLDVSFCFEKSYLSCYQNYLGFTTTESIDHFVYKIVEENNIFSVNKVDALQKSYIQPVINLKSSVSFSKGDGSIENPYVVSLLS